MGRVFIGLSGIYNRMDKKFLYGFVSAFVMLMLVSCAGLTGQNEGIFGKSSVKVAKQADRVDAITKKESANATERLNHIGAWNEGTKYSLNKLQDPPKEVEVAKAVSERIGALANKPDFDEVKEVKAIIDGLLSQMNTQQAEALKALDKKDAEISVLNHELKDLSFEKQSEVDKALKLSEVNAAKADQYKATLNEMDSFFGFGAIWYGVKTLVTKLFWGVIIITILFLVLRVAAASNPIAGAVFNIFEQMISWVIRSLKFLAPKAHQLSGMIEKNVFDGYKDTLVHIIDEIQLLKSKETGTSNKYTLDDLMDACAKSMNTDDKDRIESIKRELHWK